MANKYELSPEALEARRKYLREARARRLADPEKREREASYLREWNRKNPEKRAEYEKRRWEKKAHKS